MNKKAQAESIIIFFALMVGVFIASIIVLRLVNTIIDPFQAQIGNVSSMAGNAVYQTKNSFTNWFDYVIILLFFLNVIILLVSSFLVDIHPAFILIYIVAVMFLFIFGNYVMSAVDNIWLHMGTSTETAQTPITQFLLNHFMLILLGVVVLSGIVMYSKYKMFGGGNSNY